ncbi:MAG: glycosyltransferase family 4 protein [Myxococcota bacterium]
MRILLAGTNHRAEIRSATIVHYGFARELRDRGHRVTLLQAAKPEHREPIDGVEMLYTANTRKSLYPLIFALRDLSRYDVIHANDQSGAYFALRNRVRPLPLVVEFHAMRLRYESFWKTNWRWRYTALAAWYAPALLTPSAWLRDELRAFYGLDPARMHVIPHAISEYWFEAYRPADSESGGPLRVVLVNMKGVDVALEAFARVGPRYDARFELYGVHKQTDEYRALAHELGIAERVEFRGFVHNRELPQRLAGADVLLNPTRADNFPQILLETGALGLPAITTPVGGISEIVLDDETGLHCPIDDVDAFTAALERLLANGSLRARMSKAARERALANWRWKSVVDRIEREIYRKLCAH